MGTFWSPEFDSWWPQLVSWVGKKSLDIKTSNNLRNLDRDLSITLLTLLKKMARWSIGENLSYFIGKLMNHPGFIWPLFSRIDFSACIKLIMTFSAAGECNFLRGSQNYSLLWLLKILGKSLRYILGQQFVLSIDLLFFSLCFRAL